jgi:hypothetical protein
MDARSRLERQKARLRERLQDSSARAAAGRGEGVGGVHDFSASSASPVHLGGPCDLTALPDLPQAIYSSTPSAYRTIRARSAPSVSLNDAVRALNAPSFGDVAGQAAYIQAISVALDALPSNPYHDATRARFKALLEGRGGDDDDSALFLPRPFVPRPHVYPGGGLVFSPHRGGRVFIDCILGNCYCDG